MSVGVVTAYLLRKIIERLAGEEFLSCPFHAITGLYCPGCGGTRAIMALLSGHPAVSFLYPPAVLYGAACAAGAVIYHYYCRAKKKTPSRMAGRYVLLFGCLVLAANFIWKNGMLLNGRDILKELDTLWDHRFNISWYWL